MEIPALWYFSRNPPLKGAKASDLLGWTPIRIHGKGRSAQVVWLDMKGKRFDDPFWVQTVLQYLASESGAQPAKSSPRMLDHVGTLAQSLQPNGFIFHMSHCGAPLAADCLNALPGNRVLRQPDIIDDCLSLTQGGDRERIRRLRSLVATLGQPLDGESRYFIEFAGKSSLDLPLILRAFPKVPWIFLYRDPVEVMLASLNASQPEWYWNEKVNGLPRGKLAALSWAEVCAQVLAKICRTAVKAAGPKSLILDYAALDPATMLRHFGISPTAADLRQLTDVKRKTSRLAPATPQKARPLAQRMARQWLAPALRKLPKPDGT